MNAGAVEATDAMVVVMEERATEAQIEQVVSRLVEMGMDVHRSTGVTRTVLGAVGQGHPDHALIGLLGKLFSYVTRTDGAQLLADRRSLSPGQVRTLAKLNGLLDRSNAESRSLLHQVASISAMRAGQFFLEGN